MALQIYYDLMSQPCRALLLFLKVNSIPFESKLVALRKSEHMTPEFTQLNPLQKVPVLIHNGFVLTESIAMIRYLAREYDIEDHWYPKDSRKQARVDEYLEWQHLNTRLFGSMIFRTRVIIPRQEKKPYNDDYLEFFKEGFRNTLSDIEKSFLKDQTYLGGERMSVADIFCACEIETALTVFPDPFLHVPKVEAWLERIRKELEPHYSKLHRIIKLVEKGILMGKL